MAYCIKCNKEISAVEDNIYSGYCENCYEEIKGKNLKSDNYTHQSNTVATILKAISIIIVIISFIVFVFGIVSDEIELGYVGFAIIILSFIGSVFIYGFAEIVQLLEDIKRCNM